MAEWYIKHLGLKAVKQLTEPPYMTFLADDSDRIMIEIYCNPAAEVPSYRDMNPLQVHLAFVSDDPGQDRDRLENAGASVFSDQRYEDGSHLVMLRDPWGLAIQLCKRATPMLAATERS